MNPLLTQPAALLWMLSVKLADEPELAAECRRYAEMVESVGRESGLRRLGLFEVLKGGRAA